MTPDKLPLHEQVEYWRAEAMRQKARLSRIKSGFMEPELWRADWNLVQREVQIFQALMTARTDFVTKEALYELVYSDFEQQFIPCINTVESHVSKTKTKLARAGIRIESARYKGYRIHPDDRARILAEREVAA